MWRKSSHSACNGNCLEADMDWRKSSYSYCNSNCTEVAGLPDGAVAVRDSKDPGGPMLEFTREEWRAAMRVIKMDQLPGGGPDGSLWDQGRRIAGLWVN